MHFASQASDLASALGKHLSSKALEQLNDEQRLDLYGKGLNSAADLQRQAVKAATLRARQSACQQWSIRQTVLFTDDGMS